MLDLSANAIEGLPPLATALPALADLILDDNSLRALGDELVGLSKLKKLSAKSNRIAAVDPFSGQQVRIFVPCCWFLVVGSCCRCGRRCGGGGGGGYPMSSRAWVHACLCLKVFDIYCGCYDT